MFRKAPEPIRGDLAGAMQQGAFGVVDVLEWLRATTNRLGARAGRG